MARRKVVDSSKLIKMVEKGVHQTEILESFGFNNSTQLKVAYANALIDTGAIAMINSGRKRILPQEVPREVVVNKRGTVILPKALVESLGFREEDSFYVKRVDDRISLALIGRT